MQPAKYWHQIGNNLQVQCDLCPHSCVLSDGHKGRCGARINVDGKLYSLSYAKHAAIHLDPIEKKPLRHFLPGSQTLSLGTYGCNFDCDFCQNHSLSRGEAETGFAEVYRPEEIVAMAVNQKIPSISFTYNEPITNFEFVTECARLAKEEGIHTISVSNGFISSAAREEFFRHIDAANIDLKSPEDSFYRQYCGGAIAPVKETLSYLVEMGKHLEITNLIIPGLNDSDAQIENIIQYVAKDLHPGVPLHFSAFHPCYRFHHFPRTDAQTVLKAQKKARDYGLEHVYVGNIGLY